MPLPPDIVLDQPPPELPGADKLVAEIGGFLFAVRSDLRAPGGAADPWLLVGPKGLGAAHVNAEGQTVWKGECHLFANIAKVRSFQTVGSAFLQVLINHAFVDVIRYSNARREFFERARIQVERMLKGQPWQPEYLRMASEYVCQICGMPRPSRGMPCPRCTKARGVFVRSLGLLDGYWKYIALLLGMMIAGVLLDLVPPQLQRTLVDQVLLPRQRLNWLPRILLALVFASVCRQTLSIFIGRLASTISTRITRDLRERLERKLVGLSVDYFDRHAVGSLMSRVLYDVEYFQSFVTQVAQGFMLNLMLVLGIGLVLFAMNWLLALLVLLPIPFVVVGTMIFWRRIHPMYFTVNDSMSRMSQLLSGLFSGIRLVKAFGQEDREHGRFDRAATYIQTNRRNLDCSMATFNPIMAFIFGLGGLLIWYAGGNLVLAERITLGTLMAFFGYVAMFYAPVSALTMFSNWLTGFLAAAQRIFEVLDAAPGLADHADAKAVQRIKGGIEFKNVVFGYDPYIPILKGVSFTIEPGQFIGVVGKSGSGKSTLISLICRFYDPQQGEVLIDGKPTSEYRQEDLHRQIALVLQEPFLFRASIADNIEYGRPGASAPAIMDAAKAANAHEFIARRPAAYDTKLGERGAGLSGGERQRISIARALLCDPGILILDEATSSVDTESEQEIQKALNIIGKGRTTIAVAHRLSTLKNSDIIFVMDQGLLAEHGTHEELMANPQGIYYKLVKIQTELARLET